MAAESLVQQLLDEISDSGPSRRRSARLARTAAGGRAAAGGGLRRPGGAR